MYRRGLGIAYDAHLVFGRTGGGATSRFTVGDSWTITVTGPPNSPVVVTGGINGTSATTTMGSTDASGSFRLSGAMTADQIGAWDEKWVVGGEYAGGVSFTVEAAPNVNHVPPPPPTPPPTPPPPTPPPSSTGFDLSAIPAWGWLAGAGVLAFAVLGGRR